MEAFRREEEQSRSRGGVMQERIEGLGLLRGRWAKPRGTGTTAACVQHEPTTFTQVREETSGLFY